MKRIHVALMFNASFVLGNGLIDGVRRWALENARWRANYWGTMTRDARSQLARSIKDWEVDGGIVMVTDRFMIGPLRALRLPVVNVSGVFAPGSIPTVRPDDTYVGQLAARHFLERGYTHFGYCGHRGKYYSACREKGFVQELARHGHSCNTHCFKAEHQWYLFDQRGLLEWLTALPKPVAIMGTTDLHGRHVIVACEKLGLRVPEDVAVIGVDNDEGICTSCDPALSSVDVFYEKVGYEASRLLDKLIRGGRAPKAPTLLRNGRIIVRHSSDEMGVLDPQVSEAVRFIRQHAHESIDGRDVLRAVPICRSNLDRRFKALLGRTIYDQIWLERVEKAKNLLAGTDMKATMVAANSGFRDYTIFFNMFRKHTGMSPSAYRRQYHL